MKHIRNHILIEATALIASTLLVIAAAVFALLRSSCAKNRLFSP